MMLTHGSRSFVTLKNMCLLILLLAALSTGCSSFSSLKGARDHLKYEELFAEKSPGIVDNKYYVAITPSTAPPHKLSGTIHFSETRMNHQVKKWSYHGEGLSYFPKFSIPVVSHNGHLIPLKRGLIYLYHNRNSVYHVIVSPGRVWREPGDNGYSRASFPFTLTDNTEGTSRSGLATFVYSEDSISKVAVQITQESAPKGAHVREDFEGLVIATYIPGKFEEESTIIKTYNDELSRRLKTTPWQKLKNGDFLQKLFNTELEEADVSIAALVLDGQIYLQPPMTRSGVYPYPESLRTGVYSVTKSLGAGLAMFYLAEKYGEDVFDELITEYIPSFADHPGWKGVTFGHTLNMATGIRGSDAMKDISGFIMTPSAKYKLKAVKRLEDKPSAPGEKFAYATTNTFVLSYAMNQYVKQKEGKEADLWSQIEKEVLQPIGINHFPILRTKERKGKLGVPIMGVASFPNVDEAAKIALLLQNDGRHNGHQLLNRNKVREALNKTEWKGYAAGHGRRYQHSFWVYPNTNVGNCDIELYGMDGRGGHFISFYPKNIIVIRFADAMNYNLTHMAATVGQIKNLCDD